MDGKALHYSVYTLKNTAFNKKCVLCVNNIGYTIKVINNIFEKKIMIGLTDIFHQYLQSATSVIWINGYRI